ncbi:MAG: HAD family phosphatase [Microbacterium sp.]
MPRASACPPPPSPPKTSRAASPTPGFVAAARELGVDPAACIVVEDSANGIAAGLAAGMRVIGVGPRRRGRPDVARGGCHGHRVTPDADGGILVRSAGPALTSGPRAPRPDEPRVSPSRRRRAPRRS